MDSCDRTTLSRMKACQKKTRVIIGMASVCFCVCTCVCVCMRVCVFMCACRTEASSSIDASVADGNYVRWCGNETDCKRAVIRDRSAPTSPTQAYTDGIPQNVDTKHEQLGCLRVCPAFPRTRHTKTALCKDCRKGVRAS